MTRLLSITLILWLTLLRAYGQEISFSNINTANGLSDNFIRSVTVDKKGFLWIGTNEGLNSYDGYSVTNYSLNQYPDIPGKTIIHLLCDSKNNIWMGSAMGAAWADEKRNFHRIVLNDTLRVYYCSMIIETKKYGPVLFSDKGQFYQHKEKKIWQQLPGIPASLDSKNLVEVADYSGDSLLIATTSAVMLRDYSTGKIIYNYPFENILSLCRVSGNKVALADRRGHLFIMDISTGSILKDFTVSALSMQNMNQAIWAEVRMATGENILYASSIAGFYTIDKAFKITRYEHQPTDPHSIAGDKVYRLAGTADGNVVIGTERYGLSIFNILKKQASYQKFFKDEKGDYFDGYLTQMALDKDGTFWIGAVDRLIHWNRKTNLSVFYYYDKKNPEFSVKNSEIHRICIDKTGQIWVTIPGCGPAMFNRKTSEFKLLARDTATHPALKSNFIFSLFEDSRGKIWVASMTGFYFINPLTQKIETADDDSLLKELSYLRTHSFAEDNKHRIWISTWQNGVVCYDPAQRTIRKYLKKDGMLADNTADLMMARNGDLYVTMQTGFNIIRADGKVESYSHKEGLRYDKTDAFLEDSEGKIWIANAKCLVKFDPLTKKMETYDEHENLNNGGFKPVSSIKTPAGELLWGTQSGLNYFYPDKLTSTPEPINVNIYQVQAGDSIYAVAGNTISIPYSRNNLQFYFTAINLRGSHNIKYQYRLEGYDTKWQDGTDIRQARYSSLPPGNYQFKLRASADLKGWIESGNSFSFTIIAPVYMRWWFKLLTTLAIISALYYFFRRRTRQLQQKKEELETEQAITYFASSMYQQQTVDEILWDVAKNCIGRLQFEDCVIYLLDEKRNVLVQKAAHGPKSPRSFEITNPIDIPPGKGIVGTVAQTKKPELIADTSKDIRYIADDAVRLSEIAVPIISDGRLLGVIDCEHSKKRFFTQKHLSILTTIASLCANKILRTHTEAEKKQAEIMLTETKQKMAEAEMQALRAQMNPHFIFNCLNSINRYIVKSDQATASLYLTRFAKLIRLILDNSHSKNVLLSNEIEALKLYIEMESLRFDKKFTYEINIESNVPADSIEVPPLIIQPYIENAIWHGLLHKTESGHLKISVSLLSANMLQCIIEDNGVGRDKAAALRSKSATTKKSLGMELTESRLLLLNQYASVHSSVEIADIKDINGEASGTKVILNIPIGDN